MADKTETNYTDPGFWESAWNSAQAAYSGLVAKNPEQYRADAERFVEAMRATRATLTRMKALAATPDDVARFNRLNAQYEGLKSQAMRDSQNLGVIPVLVVLGVSFGVAGVAWAVAYWEQAAALRDRAAVELKDLEARVAASKEGRSLQQSTLPPPPDDKKPGWENLVLPGIGIAAALAAAWAFSGKKSKGAAS